VIMERKLGYNSKTAKLSRGEGVWASQKGGFKPENRGRGGGRWKKGTGQAVIPESRNSRNT